MSKSFTTEVKEVMDTHHALLRREIPRLSQAWKAGKAPVSLTLPWAQLLAVLLPHLDKEEQILFPLICGLDSGEAPVGCGVEAPIRQMTYEHDLIGSYEAMLRLAAGDAGALEPDLLALLDDLAVHAHREEFDLYPRAVARARELAELGSEPVPESPDQTASAPVAASGAAPTGRAPEAIAAAPVASAVRIVRNTRGCCNTCLADVPARVVVDEAEARLEKMCPEHGVSQQLLSRAPESWERLDRYYFSVNGESYPQRDYIVRMTEKCNLDCPICLAHANHEDTPDLPIGRLAELLSERRGIKVDLMAAEPTLREDLADWVRATKAGGGIAALHTNGLKLAKREYALHLRDAGVDEVFLQFDGLDESANKRLRGRPLNKARLAALTNLRELGIATSLIVVIAKGVNEAEVSRVIHFAAEPRNNHIREVFFLGLRMLGSNRQTADEADSLAGSALMPDEIVDILTAAEPGIKRADIEHFNKLYFAMLSAFRVKKCLYVQHYMLVRDGKGGTRPISDFIDLEALNRAAESYALHFPRHPHLAKARLIAALARQGVSWRGLPLLSDLFRLEQLFQSGMNLGEVPNRFLILGFITACDPYNFDSQVAINCGKGELSADGGFIESGAVANVLREARFDESAGRRT